MNISTTAKHESIFVGLDAHKDTLPGVYAAVELALTKQYWP